jgi:hypothetical protein
MNILFLLTVLFLSLIGWRNSKVVHEIAVRAVQRACKEAQVQLLDQTVAFRRFSLKGGSLKRVYSFDYSPDGLERFRGLIWMRGERVEMTAFDAAGEIVIPKG